MKVAIYGGSFNPPHLGHSRVLLSAIKDLSPDLVLVIPDNLPPHKELSSNAPSAEHRIEMCRIAFGDIEKVQVSDIEIRRGGRSYTYDTMCELKKIYPEDDLYLLMGMDMYESFNTWFNPEGIRSMCTLYVAPREESSESSSSARKVLSNGKKSEMLCEKVNNYIFENKLYGTARE